LPFSTMQHALGATFKVVADVKFSGIEFPTEAPDPGLAGAPVPATTAIPSPTRRVREGASPERASGLRASQLCVPAPIAQRVAAPHRMQRLAGGRTSPIAAG
jgi:hypothetical protein